MSLVRLDHAQDESVFGGKASSLARALQAGLPAPTGFALSHVGVNEILKKNAEALLALESAFSEMQSPIAVRSSAVGEDSVDSSFAGQHISVLNVANKSQLLAAIAEVAASSESFAATEYRRRLGIDSLPQMGIVLQELVHPDAAGVLFTQNPMTGADEHVIEAAWGLGEVVVAGLVVPDYYRLAPDGSVLERRIGEKDIALRILPEGGTEESDVPEDRIHASVLTDEELSKLLELSRRCQAVYGKRLDIEWCLAHGRVFLLQCRAITSSGS